MNKKTIFIIVLLLIGVLCISFAVSAAPVPDNVPWIDSMKCNGDIVIKIEGAEDALWNHPGYAVVRVDYNNHPYYDIRIIQFDDFMYPLWLKGLVYKGTIPNHLEGEIDIAYIQGQGFELDVWNLPYKETPCKDFIPLVVRGAYP